MRINKVIVAATAQKGGEGTHLHMEAKGNIFIRNVMIPDLMIW